jgi:putative transposase
MPRSTRPLWAEASYHVTARGNGGCHVFIDDADRRDFLHRFQRIVTTRNWTCLAFCLMGNHIHAALTTPEGDLDRGMRDLLGRYAFAFNRRHSGDGHLFRNRYGAVVIDSDAQMVNTIAYVLRNPVKAGLVDRPERWPWSNGAVLLGHLPERPSDVLGHRRALDWLGGDSDYARKELRALVVGREVNVSPNGRLIDLPGPGDDLQVIRRALDAGYSQEQVAQSLGTTQSTLSRRLRSQHGID